ncbi:MAG: hypothetical protein RJA07_1236 [Bacteroidota bacterium]|jgi:valyl-tRNA synthetase
MELPTKYSPTSVEDKWFSHWMSKQYFKSTPDNREAFTIVIPPPNVTGVLHMGHTLNETIQDILIRHARMTGKNACWVPGTDHASIATEAKVVAMLKERGIDKKDLSREEFLKYAFEWKDKYGGIIIHQLEKLGCSCDYDRTSFTMDDHYYKAVIKVFVDLHNKGLIYRGARMINWDPSALTALSDEEVEYKEVQSKLYYVKYRLEILNTDDSKLKTEEYITVATTRPETILGDVAICCNPEDERYSHLKGASAYVPLINRKIPIIFDEYVDKEFGTGCLKITPAHDLADYNIGLKHNLPIIDTLNPNGTLSEAAGLFVGDDRFVARKKMAKALVEAGLLAKEEDIKNKNGFSQRTNAVVEPRISTQWFLKMADMSKPTINAQATGDVKFYPDKFDNTFKYWMENIKDWCISRQLWWGQQIPAYYTPDGTYAVAESKEEAFKKLQIANSKLQIEDIKQDEDVLDTWFSSWLWPIEVFNGITEPDNKEINYYYPTNVLVTGQDIIFFWVARMMMAGFEYKNERPFADVYFTGMVRDKQGRKMSKSLGNSPELLGLIEQFGADAVRFGIMISSPAGNDLLFDESSCEQGRNFANKVWNALRLIKGWTVESSNQSSVNSNQFAIDWFENRLKKVKEEYHQQINSYRLNEALLGIYGLIWDDFCAWYLEWIKPEFVDGKSMPIDEATYNATIHFFEELMHLLHPFMPFCSEEFYHTVREQNDDLAVKQFVDLDKADETILAQGELLKQIVSSIRDAKNKNQLKPKEMLPLSIQTKDEKAFASISSTLSKSANLSAISFTDETVKDAIVFVVGQHSFYLQAGNLVNKSAQKEELEKELNYLQGFLKSVETKLSNEKFVANAKPELVAIEKKKQADAESKIKSIKESLVGLTD